VLAVYDRSDAEIAQDVWRDIAESDSPVGPGTLEVSVAGGVVTLAGCPPRPGL
jgi:hypothetical protein